MLVTTISEMVPRDGLTVLGFLGLSVPVSMR